MAASTIELISRVRGLQKTAMDLSTTLQASGTKLSKSIGVLHSMTKGSKSGSDAIAASRAAVTSLEKAVTSLTSLKNSCGDFISIAMQ